MNKSLALSALGITGAGTSLTGAYYLGAFESKEGIKDKGLVSTFPLSTNISDWEIDVVFSNFLEDYKIDCVEKIFNPKPTGSLSTWEENVTEEKDDGFSLSTNKKSSGCLSVKMTKYENKDSSQVDKWAGQMAFLWAFAQEDRGFLAYATFSFLKEEGKAKAESLIYTLSKESTENANWKITSKYKNNNGVEIDVGKIPKNGKNLSELSNEFMWGLAKNEEDLKNLVKESDLTQRNLKVGGFYFGWTGTEKNHGQEITSWSSNLNEWWDKVFKDEKNGILNKVKDFKGEWQYTTKQNLE